MGYTHYFRKKDGLTEANWGGFTEDVKKVLKDGKDIIQFEYDEDAPAIANDHYVRFNGIEDEGHETFVLDYEKSRFDFCKTARKPYDKYVTACLILAKVHFGNEITVSSDGDLEDWNEGLELVKGLTGITLDLTEDIKGKFQVAVTEKNGTVSTTS